VLKSRKIEGHRDDFIEFLGVWSEEEAKAFEEAIRDLERIDPEDWV
jgi:hypothetical protein